MNDLKEALENSSVENPNELIDKIEKRYNLGLEAGLTEEEIEEMIGDVDLVVDQYIDSLIDEDDENADETSTKSYAIEISTIGADVSIELVDAKDIEYELIDINVDYYDIITEKNEFKIKYKKTKFLGLNRKASGQILVKLPNNIHYDRINVKTTSGDVTISNPLNSNVVKLSTVSGDMNFDNINCDTIKLSVVSGDICGLSIEGKEVYVDTVSGDMTCNMINCDDLLLSTINGDINIAHATANIKASTVTGEILTNNNVVGVNVKKTIKGLFR